MSDSNKSNLPPNVQYDLIIKVADRLNEVRDDVSHIKVTLERNTASLEAHMRRTELNEQALATYKAELLPIKQRHDMQTALLKLLVGAGAAMAFIASAAKLVETIMQHTSK